MLGEKNCIKYGGAERLNYWFNFGTKAVFFPTLQHKINCQQKKASLYFCQCCIQGDTRKTTKLHFEGIIEINLGQNNYIEDQIFEHVNKIY